MPQITLHIQPGFRVEGHPPCFSGTPFAIKVQRVLQFKKLSFEVAEVGWLDRALVLPKLSASHKLPVLDYDGERIEDSSDIARYIEERHPEPPLLPADPHLLARCHFIEEWADDVLYWYGVYEQLRITQGDVVGRAYYRDLPEEFRRAAERDGAKGAARAQAVQGIGRYPPEKVKADVGRGLDQLVVLVEADGFLAGSQLCLADVAVFGQLHRRLAGTNPWLEEQVAARGPLADWVERVDALTS